MGDKNIHINSLEAYFEEDNKKDFSKREKEILGALEILKSGTARDIMTYLGYTELNEVRPRLTELKHKNIIHEIGKVKEKRTPVSIYALK